MKSLRRTRPSPRSIRLPMSAAGAHPSRGAAPPPPSGASVSQAAAPAHAPRWQRRKEARPGELLAAALEQFVEKGYAATKLEDVARRAGVTKGTMYLYFESKEALFKAVVRANVLPHLEHAEQLVAAHQGSARDLLVQFMRGWMDTLYNTPLSGLAKLIISESANFPEVARFFHDEVVDRKHRLMRGILERGVASGEFRSLDVEHAARVLRAPVILAAVWKHSLIKSESCVLDAPAFFEAALDVMLHGVLAEREPHTEKPNA